MSEAATTSLYLWSVGEATLPGSAPDPLVVSGLNTSFTVLFSTETGARKIWRHICTKCTRNWH